jgi:DNA-binding NarL/FixJ family response regulator
MPDKDGMDVLTQLKNERPALLVLMVSMHPEEQYAVRALKAGASGYLTKESAPDELIVAIRKVSTGRKYVSSALAERLAALLQEDAEALPHEALSSREYQVMCMIASGKTLKEIGGELSLSIKTISTYRSRILEKMKMRNNAELIHYAVKNRLVH